MDDNVAYQVCDHAFAIAKWTLMYIKKHGLRFDKEDRSEILEFHLKRLDVIFNELEDPLSLNPLMPDAFLQANSSDTNLTEPPSWCCYLLIG